MIFSFDNNDYNVIIIKKNNKNTYLRIDEKLNIVITTNYFVTKKRLNQFLNDNYNSIIKMIKKQKQKNIKNNSFFYLGKKYDIIYDVNYKNIKIDENKIFAPNEDKLEKWIKSEMKLLYENRLNICYNRFEENIPFPNLKIRKMKTRWGVCNIKTKTITINSLLFKESTEKLDYVIIHELSHLIYFNHSKNFWSLVSKYCPNYKQIRNELKE